MPFKRKPRSQTDALLCPPPPQRAPMWPSQYWGVPQGSPRSLCLKRRLKCWALAFPLPTPQQRNAPTALRTDSPPLTHHGYERYDGPHVYKVSSFLIFSLRLSGYRHALTSVVASLSQIHATFLVHIPPVVFMYSSSECLSA